MSEDRVEVAKAVFDAVVNGRPVTPAQELELIAFIRGADESTEPANGAALATRLIKDCQRVLAEHVDPGGRGEKSAINAPFSTDRARESVCRRCSGHEKAPVRSETFTA